MSLICYCIYVQANEKQMEELLPLVRLGHLASCHISEVLIKKHGCFKRGQDKESQAITLFRSDRLTKEGSFWHTEKYLKGSKDHSKKWNDMVVCIRWEESGFEQSSRILYVKDYTGMVCVRACMWINMHLISRCFPVGLLRPPALECALEWYTLLGM